MQDGKSDVSQVQRNQSQAFDMTLNGKKFDKTSIFTIGGNSQVELVAGSESGDSEDLDDSNSDVISDLIGHIGSWQLFWALMMCLFQFPTTFHIFSLVFQVSIYDFRNLRPCPDFEQCIAAPRSLFQICWP